MYRLAILVVLILAACSTGAFKVFPDTEYEFSGRLNKDLSIYTYGGSSYSAPRTTMVPAGGVLINVANEKGGEVGPGLSIIHAKNLETIFLENNLFESVVYKGDGELSDSETSLSVTFKDVYLGEDGWPLEVTAHYQLISDSAVLMDEEYKVKATLLDSAFSCRDCAPIYVALEMLNSKLFPDLNRAIGGTTFSIRSRSD